LQDGVSKRIRLWGIDAPEMNQAFGSRAKQFTGDLAFGKAVTLRVHDVDRYGRQVAKIILPDGRNLNREIVAAGLAWWYRQYAKHDTELERLEAQAKTAKRGLWADIDPMPPWEFRKAKLMRKLANH
jgi:micrococcal nuclease